MTTTVTAAPAAAAWRVLASDGNCYATLAALAAAGKTPWPGLPQGAHPSQVYVRSRTAALADGSPVLVAFNQSAAPAADATAHLVSGAGQVFGAPGVDLLETNPVWNIWFKQTVAGDNTQFTMVY